MPALLIKPNLPWLAPLAGYSNLPFRLLCRELGAYATCTEMVSAKGIYYSLQQTRHLNPDRPNAWKSGGTWALLLSPEEETPLIIQLFGAEPNIIKAAAEAVLEIFSGREIYFDLNMGCSVPKVVKTGCGAAMLQDLPNAMQAAQALIAAAGPGRAGFKLRLGWLNGDDVYLEYGKRLADAGAAWLTLHPRYGKQSFTGRADWSKIKKLKASVTIPVVASGDMLSPRSAVTCLDETGADAVMFARGAMNNPFIFREFNQLMQGKEPALPSYAELLKIIRQHASLARTWLGDRYALSQMRGFIPRYAHHFPGVRMLRQQLTSCESWERMDIIISQFILNIQELSGN